MKSALSIFLTLVLTAGPWLCCCTAGHIARTESAPASAPHQASCCGSSSQSNESPDDTPLAPGRSCSCQAEIQPATLAISGDPLPDTPLLVMLPMDSGVSFELAIAASLVNESLPCSFLESRDILRVFHILRC